MGIPGSTKLWIEPTTHGDMVEMTWVNQLDGSFDKGNMYQPDPKKNHAIQDWPCFNQLKPANIQCGYEKKHDGRSNIPKNTQLVFLGHPRSSLAGYINQPAKESAYLRLAIWTLLSFQTSRGRTSSVMMRPYWSWSSSNLINILWLVVWNMFFPIYWR
jgi:hypothetical protein